MAKHRNGKKYNTHWVTKDGSLIKPSQMGTDHLLNALNHCIRVVQTRVLLTALGHALKGEPNTAKALEEVAVDNGRLRALCTYRWPVTLLMEQEILRRHGVLHESR